MERPSPGKPSAGPRQRAALRALALTAALGLSGCSFDYGDIGPEGEAQPDLVMEDLEYVRVRDGDPVLRFQADRAERYESARSMVLEDMRFEQFTPNGAEVDAVGRAAAARIDLASGDAHLSGGVRVTVPSEDISIETSELFWLDKDRLLQGAEAGAALIKRGDGSMVSGTGFSADARRRTWEFSSRVEGLYVEEDKEPPEALPAEVSVPQDQAGEAR